MRINYNNFYLKFGNRTVDKLQAPRIFNLSKFILPKQNAFHYFGSTNDDVGPSKTNPMFAETVQRIPIYFYQDLITRLGNMNVRAFMPLEVIRKYIKQNHKFIPCYDLSKVKPNPLVPVILNYAICDKRYKYLGNEIRIPYYKNTNIINTFIKGMKDIYDAHGDYYNQFIFLNVPDLKDLPKVSEMKMAANTVTNMFFTRFNTLEKLIIFELWKWLGLNRNKSIFKNIPLKILDKINIVFISNNVFTYYSLGQLDRWRKSDENKSGKLDPTNMSKNFVKMLIELNKASTDSSLIELTEEEVLEQEAKETEDFKGSDDESNKDKQSNSLTDIKDKNTDIAEDVENNEVNESDENEEENGVDDIDITENIVTEDSADLTVQKDLDIIGDIIDEEDDVDYSESLDSKEQEKKNNINISRVVSIPTEQEEEFNDRIDTNLDVSDILNVSKLPIEEIPVLVTKPKETKTAEEKAKAALDYIAKNQNMTVSKYDGIRKSIGKYRNLKLTNDSKMTVGEMVNTKPEELEISNEDKEVSTLNVMGKRYIEKHLERDVAAMMVGIQGGGAIVHDIRKQTHENIMGGYDVYSMKIKPIEGEQSTIRVKLPRVNSDGKFKVSGVDYVLRNQRRDLPIRKINDSTVALTSYFGKTFAKRDTTRQFNYEKWLIGQIRAIAFNPELDSVKETRSGNVFDNNVKAPDIYSLLSMHFRAVTTKDAFIYFDYHKANERFGNDLVRSVESKGLFFAGSYKGKFGLGVNKDGIFYSVIGNEVTELGDIESMCGIDSSKAPVESVTIDIMGKPLPIGLVLGYKLGLTKLIAALKPKYYKTVKTGTRVKLESHEFMIKFSDFSLVLSRKDRMASLILSGLSKCDTSDTAITLLDRKEIYFNLLESIKIPGRYVKEIDLYNNMFVDPITERILIEMNEPTDFTGLLIRSVELLLTRYHADEVDMTGQRIAGYERMAGEVYKAIVNSLREHNRHGIKANYPIELNPEAVWMSILKDTSKQTVENLNPIQDLKQQEVTTFSGNGGRGKKSMVKRTRIHHKTSIGVISEATVDSSDAGVTTYMSANPKFKSLYGLPENSGTEEVNKDLKPENVFSTAMMMYPCSDTDDPKRAVFLGTQINHTLSTSNGQVMPLRTGYDEKLVERCSDVYASTAEQDGIITDVNDFAITVTYKDGSTKQVEIGRRYGSSGGFNTAHDITTHLKKGDKVKKGDAIAYNSDFFTSDPMKPGKLAMKTGVLGKVALIEHPYTFEDSTAITRNFGENTRVKTVVKKEVVVNFDQSIHRLAKPGTVVKIDDPLCYIEDSITHDGNLFDENSIDLLRNLSKSAPKSSINGVIDKVEVFYNGDKEDMSESLMKIANASDNKLVALQKALGKKPYTGEVDDTYRVDGNPLLVDTAVIVFTISSNQGISVGDKC